MLHLHKMATGKYHVYYKDTKMRAAYRSGIRNEQKIGIFSWQFCSHRVARKEMKIAQHIRFVV